MEAELKETHGIGRDGSKAPEVAELVRALNRLSTRVYQAETQGSPITDTDLKAVLANLDMTPSER